MAAKGWIHCMATHSHDAGTFDAGDLKAAEGTLKI
jgi:hypothetical protein